MANQAHDGKHSRQMFVSRKGEQGFAAPFACLDLELSLLAFTDYKVLQKAVRCNARLEFGIGRRVGALAYVSG